MAAKAVYQTWLGTQGERRAVAAAQEEWKPPGLVTKLDHELPEAVGHVVMQLRAPRSSAQAMVFQLPSKPALYFCIYVDEGFSPTDPHYVEVYALEAPSPSWGLLANDLPRESALAVLRPKTSYAELRDYVPPEGGLARVKAEQEAAAASSSSSCALV
jgi:hypothetical protein